MTGPLTQTVEILVNGRKTAVPSGATIADALQFLGIASDRVAVEKDREIVSKGSWAETPLDAGSELEIVQFVGGG